MRRLKRLVVTLAVLLAGTTGIARAESLPESAQVNGLVGRAQTYRLSCESRSAADLAAYWGVPVEETAFFASLPVSDNPELGFVGNVHGRWGNVPPFDYGVHAPPVAAQLRALGLEATAERGLSWDALRAEIAAGRPAIVWIIGAIWAGAPQIYVAADGATTTVAPFEHTMILTGYTPTTVTLVDAADGRTLVVRHADFLASWSVLGNMAVLVRGSDKGVTTSPAPSIAGAGAGPESGATDGSSLYVVRPGDRLATIAARAGIAWPDLARANNLFPPYTIYVGQSLRIPAAAATGESEPPTLDAASGVYLVQPGDQLGRIATRLGVDWQAMARLNGLVPPYIVYVGQTLQVPAEAMSPDSSVAEAPLTIVVQPGETLSQIAARYGLTWQALAALNGIVTPNQIYAYQTLRIR